MSNVFSSIQLRKPKKNRFNLSYDVKTTLNMGDLVPVHVQECVPGDYFEIGCQSLLRFAPLISPVMHRVDVYTHYFFVPNRILWKHWETFITHAKNGKAIPESEIPALPTSYVYSSQGAFDYAKRLMDYMGLPFGRGVVPSFDSPKFSLLPFLAYQKIYDEYYRDQNLIDSPWDAIAAGLNDGNNDFDKICDTLLALRKRAWKHDYFTSCLPFAQKGDAITMPLLQPQQDLYVKNNHVGSTPVDEANWQATDLSGNRTLHSLNGQSSDPNMEDGKLFIDGKDIQDNATTINDLRTAFRLQEWLEKSARAGSRYFEQLRSFFGVMSPDSRMQRPEYIGGSKSPVVISEVLQTSQSDQTAQGNMSGHGISFDKGGYSKFKCPEHGYIIGIVSVLPTTAYQQGIPRHFSKTDKLDYLWPEFAHLGEQAVLNKELYVDGTAADNATFGYIPRYSEYRFNPSLVSGDFKNTLNFWHMGRIFGGRPNLNQQFIEANPTNRIFAVEDPNTDHLYMQIYHTINAVRPLPKYGTPMGL